MRQAELTPEMETVQSDASPSHEETRRNDANVQMSQMQKLGNLDKKRSFQIEIYH